MAPAAVADGSVKATDVRAEEAASPLAEAQEEAAASSVERQAVEAVEAAEAVEAEEAVAVVVVVAAAAAEPALVVVAGRAAGAAVPEAKVADP